MTRPLPRYVNAFTAKRRRYYYFRRPGMKNIRLPDFGTSEFEIEYQRAFTQTSQMLVRSERCPVRSMKPL